MGKNKESITFASMSDCIEAEGKARRRLEEIRVIHQKNGLSWDFLVIMVDVARKKLVKSYVNDWLHLNYKDDIVEVCRCFEILKACDAYYEEAGLESSYQELFMEGGILDGFID